MASSVASGDVLKRSDSRRLSQRQKPCAPNRGFSFGYGGDSERQKAPGRTRFCVNFQTVGWVSFQSPSTVRFFSPRLNIRISAISIAKNRLSTALPKDPVPPEISKHLF
jgi:hypothetical protein